MNYGFLLSLENSVLFHLGSENSKSNEISLESEAQ